MEQQTVRGQQFWPWWIIANVVGFLVGSFLGATDGGVVGQVLGAGIAAHIIGDLVFGLCFGVAQCFVLQRFYPESRARLWLWIPASMVGFSVGARLGARIAPMAGDNQLAVGFVFGIVMGTSLSLVEWAAIQFGGALKTARPYLWIPTTIAAWVLGETIAFQFRFSLASVPLTALAIAFVSGIALLWWIRPR